MDQKHTFKNNSYSSRLFILLLLPFCINSLCPDSQSYFEPKAAVNLSGGTLESPTKVTRLTLPTTSEVDSRRASYYAITALNPGTTYNVSLVRLEDDVDLFVYDSDSSFTTTVCTGETSGLTGESCNFTATGAAVFVKVIEKSTADVFIPIGYMMRIQ